jgi:TolA-binding protein/peroxiredoxin
VNRITAFACLLLTVAARAQGVDQQIQRELEGVLELAAAPKEATEEQRKAKVEQFKGALVRFVATWEPRAGELGPGRFALARGLLLLGKPEQAIPHLEQFVRDNPKSEDLEQATLSLAGAYLDAHRHDRAEAVYQEFLASRPSSPQRIVARYYLAITHIEAGKPEAGISDLADIAKTGGEHPLVADASLKLVQTLAETGRTAEAREHLAALLKDHPDAPALVALKGQLDWIGKPAPEIEGVRTWLNGTETSFAALRGSVVVVTFFAEPYDTSRVELGNLRDLAAQFADKPVRFLGLTTYYRKKTRQLDEEDQLLRQFLETQGVKFPIAVVLDFRMLVAFGVRGVPYTVVIGPTGNVEYLKIGASRADTRGINALKAAIERALPPPK